MLYAVINKDSLMRRRLRGKLHGGRWQLLFAFDQSSIDSQLFVENRDFCLPTCIRHPRYGSPSNTVITFAIQTLEWFGYQMVKKSLRIRLLVLNRIHERDRRIDADGRTDTALRHRPRLHSIARQ